MIEEVRLVAEEFGADDPARVEARAAHLLFNAGVPGYKLLELMRSARLRTDGGLRGGRVDNPVAYYFGALEGLIDEWRERRGLPPRRRAGAARAPGAAELEAGPGAVARDAPPPGGGTAPGSAVPTGSEREAAIRGYALWANALTRLEARLPATQFDRYVRDTRGDAYDESAGVLRVVALFEDHVRTLCGPLAESVSAAVQEVAGGRPIRVEFVAPPARAPRSGPRHQVRWRQADSPPPGHATSVGATGRLATERSHHVA